MKSTATNKTKKVRVIPGYHLTLGITVTMLSLIVLIPLASVMVSALKLRPVEFWSLITKPTVRHAFATSIGCSFIAALINSVFGVIIAWVLVRYEFPGKRILDGCIELPFALPTSVAGITLSKMYSENGILGTPLAKLGIKVSYTHLGLVIALVFVGIPFVIRAVQPVLEKLDGQYEEAAFMLGANRFQTFRRFLAYPAPAIAAKFPACTPKNRDIIAIITRISPLWIIYPRFPSAMPISIIFAISRGINTSISTSNVTRRGAMMDCFLYSRTDCKSFLFIFFTYLLMF